MNDIAKEFEVDDSRERFESHPVRITDSFYCKYIKDYRGCPRGAEGTPVNTSIRDWLLHYKDNLLRGTDDTFVAIPRCLFEYLVQSDLSNHVPYNFKLDEIDDCEYKQITKIGGVDE